MSLHIVHGGNYLNLLFKYAFKMSYGDELFVKICKPPGRWGSRGNSGFWISLIGRN